MLALGLFVGMDLLRPHRAQTYLGQLVVHGDVADQIARKGARALASVQSPLRLLIVIGGAALVAVRPRIGDRPTLRAAAWALAVGAMVGSAVNDSGLVVGAAVMAVAWPALVVLGSTSPDGLAPADRPLGAGGEPAQHRFRAG